MENVFKFRDDLIRDYGSFSRSFTRIAAPDIANEVERQYQAGRYWPEPLIQINPNFQRKGTVQELVAQGRLHPECANIFQINKLANDPQPLHLFSHQLAAINKAQEGKSFVVTTGTGSGKSLAFFIPIIDRILKQKAIDPRPRTRALVIYPMNALANSQLEELGKFLHGYPKDAQPFTVARYTGQEKQAERDAIGEQPPDILLTNFMMLELILTRFKETDLQVIAHCSGLEFLVLDELHTYRGRQGADVAMLVRRLRERLQAHNMVCIGTSATMSSTGTWQDRNQTVAEVAQKIFGSPITAHDVIGETLERVTDGSKDGAAIRPMLAASLQRNSFTWSDFAAFTHDPLAIWVELNLGIELRGQEPPARAKPLTLSQAVTRLTQDAGCSEAEAQAALRQFLLAAQNVTTPEQRAPFAFKLHQYISGPGKVHTTLEPEHTRNITLDAQTWAPGRQHEGVLLYPTHFCRECGQEYHPVWRSKRSGGLTQYLPRQIDDAGLDDEKEISFGFLCPQRSSQEYKGKLETLPEFWLDLSKLESKGEIKVKPAYKAAVPLTSQVNAQGHEGSGPGYWFIPGKFRFCLHCLDVHEAHGKDIHRLASLSGEGRASATTMLTLSALRQLFDQRDIPPHVPDPRKLLCFTDNRQDAALQAGHFNDFVFLLSLRSGLIAALQANSGTLAEESLADEVFKALGFTATDPASASEYLKNPKLIGFNRQEAQRALRFVLGYRLLRDLRKGWRLNNPNLDQLQLLAIDYRNLDEFCADEALFANQHSNLLGQLGPNGRAAFARTVFDEMRRSLCLTSRYLDPLEQDKASTHAHNYLNERWAFALDEKLATSRTLILSSRPEKNKTDNDLLVLGGARSRLLRILARAEFWKASPLAGRQSQLKTQDYLDALQAFLQAAKRYGYVQPHTVSNTLQGWRLNASVLDWRLCADQPQDNSNAFFRALYQTMAGVLQQPAHHLFEFEAHEHTAQVEAARRQVLEQRFRFTRKDRDDWEKEHDAPLARLPVMYCSPTMELGVDISALNTVFLRNVPPTPANYAQRSGRAGRSGQQALVLTYCAALSPHDQWFFYHAQDMVYGEVRAPTLDLSNRDLIESHLHAVWLASTATPLDNSIAPLLDLTLPGKPLRAELAAHLANPEVLQRATQQAQRVIAQLGHELDHCTWNKGDYVERVIHNAPTAFAQAMQRWRGLLEATQKQMQMADDIAGSHAVSDKERQNARRRYGDAARQYAVLLKEGNAENTDFYTYRYLASQGFLPGYNFPRLPLMAWIPAHGGKSASGKDDEGSMVSRPRFLALSEFGPRSLIYHEGRMFRVVRAKLNVSSADHVSGNSTLATISARICNQCGYGHLGEEGALEPLVNCCENCGSLLDDTDWVKQLYRIETVETRPEERISVNDEERQRQGFDLQTTYRFVPGPDGTSQQQRSQVVQTANNEDIGNETHSAPEVLATLTYSPAARLWRINRGWRRRKNKLQLGFIINPISGQWSKQDEPDANPAEREEAATDKIPNQRIVPFVEDHRNILILAPRHALTKTAMATLQAALKRGIEQTFQIEEAELVAEPLPRFDERKGLLFYEAAEGGAGVLSRLANDPGSLAKVADTALRLMHFLPGAGAWSFEGLQEQLEESTGQRICEAGCYRCLLSYFNQTDHLHIDRHDVAALQLLVALANASVQPERASAATIAPATVRSAATVAADDMLATWLAELDKRQLQRPDALNVPINHGEYCAAAQYKERRVLVFLQVVGQEMTNHLRDKGWVVLDFSDFGQWAALFVRHANVLNKSLGSRD